MRAFFLSLLLAGLTLCGAVNAKVEAQAPSIAAKSPEGKEVCYPEALSEQDRKDGLLVPCAPKNYTHLPSVSRQGNALTDSSHIWSDKELANSFGASIYENKARVGDTEVTLSMATGGLCGTPSKCPFRVKFQTPGKPDVVLSGNSLACAADNYFFIRNDLKEVLGCGEHFPLE